MRDRTRIPAVLFLLSLGAAGVAFNFWITYATRNGRNTDFDTYYAAGKLAGSGRLYDWSAIRALEEQHSSHNPLPFGRIPAVALAVKPLSALPYRWAVIAWLCAGMGALAGFVALWPLSHRLRGVTIICWSYPAAVVLAFGQDTLFLLLFAALGLWLLRREHSFAAGLVFSLCVIKPHLALLLPVWLVAQRQWRALWGGVAGGIAILLISFAVEGISWPRRFLASASALADAPGKMPNLRGSLFLIGGGLPVEISLALVLLVAFWYLSRSLDLTSGAALALAGGLLLSHHAYIYDAVLLLPALLMTYEMTGLRWLRIWTALLFTPIPYMMLLSNAAWPAHLALTGFTLALFASKFEGKHGGAPGIADGLLFGRRAV